MVVVVVVVVVVVENGCVSINEAFCEWERKGGWTAILHVN